MLFVRKIGILRSKFDKWIWSLEPLELFLHKLFLTLNKDANPGNCLLFFCPLSYKCGSLPHRNGNDDGYCSVYYTLWKWE